MKFRDLNLLTIGHSIQLVGAIYAGEGKQLLVYLPGENDGSKMEELEMTTDEWAAFLRQTDLLETEILSKDKTGKIAKAIYRKSQRQVDQNVAWNVFRRDNYTCRYCGKNDVPLTVDHLVLWEEGGPSIEANLLSSCRKDNKTRDRTPYKDWIEGNYYLMISKNLPPEVLEANIALISTLGAIPRAVHTRSR